MYIKLDESMDLVITINEPIYRGDNLNRKIIYLIPTTVGEVDMLTASVYLSFIRADGSPDVVILERMDEKYKETYFQYRLPITCELSRYAGEICTWLQILDGAAENPIISKSGECVLRVMESKDMDDYLGDRNIIALYQLHSAMKQGFATVSDDLSKKADGLVYDESTRMLQLKSNGELINEAVKVPSDDYHEEIAEEVEDTWSDMTDTTPDEGESPWESM